MTFNSGDEAALRYIIYRIRREASSQNRKKYAIENLCDRATTIMNKAVRRSKRPVTLRFEENDFDC